MYKKRITKNQIIIIFYFRLGKMQIAGLKKIQTFTQNT